MIIILDSGFIFELLSMPDVVLPKVAVTWKEPVTIELPSRSDAMICPKSSLVPPTVAEISPTTPTKFQNA